MGALLSATYAKLRSECQLLGVSERFAAIEFPLIAKVPKLGVSQGVFLAKLIEKLLFNSGLSEIGGSLRRYHPFLKLSQHLDGWMASSNNMRLVFRSEGCRSTTSPATRSK